MLDEFADKMALRVGGKHGLQRAIASENTATLVYSSGLQVSGTFAEAVYKNNIPVYLRTQGLTALSFEDKQLSGHDNNYHKDGFGSPIGKLKNSSKPLELMTNGDLADVGIVTGKFCEFGFESGVNVKGELQSVLRRNEKILLMSFKNCTVTYEGKTLFEPAWGFYDMAVGEKIASAFSGAADPNAFGLSFAVPKVKTMKILHSPEAITLHELYQEVRDIREGSWSHSDLRGFFEDLKRQFPDEWLLPVEIAELVSHNGSDPKLQEQIKSYLSDLSDRKPHYRDLIANGFDLFM